MGLCIVLVCALNNFSQISEWVNPESSNSREDIMSYCFKYMVVMGLAGAVGE